MNKHTSKRKEFLCKLQNYCNLAQSNLERLGLIIFDLKDYHRINAMYGFDTGDLLLNETWKRIDAAGFKNTIVDRIGNDEFALILQKVQDTKLLTLAANKVVRTLAVPFEVNGYTIKLDIVIGISSQEIRSDKVSESAEKLLIEAEINLREAKKQNQKYLESHSECKFDDLDWELESDLHLAVIQNELQLYYQPKINLETEKPTQAEALARWIHPNRGMVSPEEFIPILEQTGDIFDMTKWAIHVALRQLKEWPKLDETDQYSVSINVSSHSLENPDFYQIVKRAIGIWGINPEQLTIEITEGALIAEEHSSYSNIFKLKDLGLKISIDDFGTGYSCLSYFKRIPADELKIDQSFIRNLKKDKDDEHITRVIIELAHRFSMKVVAEGVEDEESCLKLKEFGCDFIQGYYFSKPISQEKYCQWLLNFKMK